MATRVGMIRIILGMNRTDSRARIGPMIRPRNRSMLVHSPPPATRKKVSAHSELEAMATTRPTRRAATMGRPRTGTIENSGTDGGPPTAWGGAAPTSTAVSATVSVMAPLLVPPVAPHHTGGSRPGDGDCTPAAYGDQR